MIIKILKYLFMILFCLLNSLVLFYASSFFFSFSKSILINNKKLCLILCFIIVLILIFGIAVRKIREYNNHFLISKNQLKILNVVTTSIFFIFLILFIIKSSCEGWERGSEIYMNSLSPVIIPLFSSLVLAIVNIVR